MGTTNSPPIFPNAPTGTWTLAALNTAAVGGTGGFTLNQVLPTSDFGNVVYRGPLLGFVPDSYLNRYRRPYMVGAIGDSITQKNQLLFELNPVTQPGVTAFTSYSVRDRTFQAQAWLMYGAMRGQRRWAAWDYNPGFSGGLIADILQTVLPAFLGYPGGLPDACVVLGGTNDAGNSTPIATSISGLRQIYNALIAAGVTPIACLIPPRSGNAPQVLQLNLAIQQLARELNVRLVDFWSPLVAPATGVAATHMTVDGIHPTALGASLMGYQLNQVVAESFDLARNRILGHSYAAGLSNTLINDNPNFTASITGSVNSTSSYPVSTGWVNPPTDPTMCKVCDSAGTEPGTASTFTMEGATPALGGSGGPAINYMGRSFSIIGNGTASYQANNTAAMLSSIAAGDRIALAFRIKAIFGQGNTNPGIVQLIVKDNTNQQQLAGFFCADNGGNLTTDTSGMAQIGNETNYPAGDFYSEFTVPSGMGTNLQMNMRFSATTGPSNSGDSVTLANVRIMNLTKLADF